MNRVHFLVSGSYQYGLSQRTEVDACSAFYQCVNLFLVRDPLNIRWIQADSLDEAANY